MTPFLLWSPSLSFLPLSPALKRSSPRSETTFTSQDLKKKKNSHGLLSFIYLIVFFFFFCLLSIFLVWMCFMVSDSHRIITNFFFLILFIYLFIFGCVGSSFLCEGSPQLRQVGATPHRGARAPHHRGLSCCGAQAPDAQAQQLWLTGPAAPRHVGSSQTRARTRVPCIGRQTLNHCATKEAPSSLIFW